MHIDIDRLTEAELADLNHRIVERLRFLQQARAHVQMLEFRIGDRVSFQTHGRETVVGTITRYNKRTVSVVSTDGRRWTVHPSFLQLAPTNVAAHVVPGNQGRMTNRWHVGDAGQ